LLIEETNLANFTGQVMDMVKFQADSKKLEPLLFVQPLCPQYIHIDDVRVRQVLVNLLGNAVKFTNAGEVELRVTLVERLKDTRWKLRFTVRDTGIGIAEQNKARIFEAFSQEDSSITRKFGGTGLGLSISNKLLGLMNSRLELHSEIGKGSVFYFDLEVNGSNEALKDLIREPLALHKMLVVDDNETHRAILREMLVSVGIEVVEASSGADALEIVTAISDIDAVVLNQRIPEMDGIETARALRNLPGKAGTVPILLLYSSTDPPGLDALCQQLAMESPLAKPVKYEALLQALARIGSAPGTPEIQEHKPHSPLPSSSMKQILLVDDNPVNLLLTKAILRKVAPNAAIIEATNGADAVEEFRKSRPDLILMDVQMPEMNGYEATAAMRALEGKSEKRVPIIALTAGTIKGEKERCLEAGMDEYLPKPITQKLLEMVITPFLESSPSVESLRTNSHFNREEFEKRMGYDTAFINELINVTKGVLTGILEELKIALENQDLKHLRLEAHKLKGTALNLCMQPLADLANELEKRDQFDAEILSDKIHTLEEEITRVLGLLQVNG
jgi:two-component system, sensor histidine kinase and response regulator